MNKRKLWLVIPAITVAVLLGAADCDDSPAVDAAKQQRQEEAQKTVLCGRPGESLECKNLAEFKRRNSDPNKIQYVYLYNFDGSIKGYFAIKGKVSSRQSQMGPTDTTITLDRGSYGNSLTTVEAPGDDGSYGPNEEGIFFFTTSGVLVTYSGEYIVTDAPLALEVKKLG